MDEEDDIECKCYIIICVTPDGKIFADRVYKNRELAQKRIDYLNSLSEERGKWIGILSELGK